MGKARFSRQWLDFVAWCQARRLRAMPAHPWTVAAYARWCEPRHRLPTILSRVRAIAEAHAANGATPPDTHPIVTRTLRTIENRRHNRRAARLVDVDDFSASPPPAAPEQAEPANRRPRTLRNTPRLVRRRPGAGRRVSGS